MLSWRRTTMVLSVGCIYFTLTCLVGGTMSSCRKPLGLENGNITDGQFSYHADSWGAAYMPTKGRLNGKSCYCTPSANSDKWDQNVYITIDLKAKYVITSIGFQRGLPDYPVGSEMKLFAYKDGNEVPYNDSTAIVFPTTDRQKMDQIYDIVLKPEIVTQKIKMKFKISANHHCLKMELYGCLESEIAPSTKVGESLPIALLVVVVLLVLLLVIFVLLCYRYRKNMCQRCILNKHDYESSHYNKGSNVNDVHYLQAKPHDKFTDADEIYDAITVTKSPDSDLLLQDGSRPVGAAEYHEPDLPSQIYAEPDTKLTEGGQRESLIYSGSAIYGTTYENPYKSTVGSCMYAEPDKFITKGLIREFPRAQLEFVQEIGVGQFGEVHICRATGLDEIYGNIGENNSWGLPDTAYVAVKMLKSTDCAIEEDFLLEVDVMAQLKHENVVRLLGICSDHPKLMVVEYMENGDLNEFLGYCRPPKEGERWVEGDDSVLKVDQLVHMSQQIAAGMEHLHYLDFIHRDLATRNCLVGHAYKVKIADFGMSRDIYSEHYYRVEGKAILPIRWMAPECLYYGKFTMETDVWSFGVTLWEIFSFARDSPYYQMSDPEVIEAACEHFQNNRPFPYLPRPRFCPTDVHEVILQCWAKDARLRPTFSELTKKLHTMCAISELSI